MFGVLATTATGNRSYDRADSEIQKNQPADHTH